MFQIKKMGHGLREKYQKFLIKLDTIKGSPEAVANGFATGVAVSFTPFVGFHMLIALFIAEINKQNKMAAMLGTIAGNPWTFPLIWYADFYTGKIILIKEGIKQHIDFLRVFKELFHSIIMLDFSRFFSDIYPIFIPMLIGCIPFCIITWITLSKVIGKTLENIQNKGERADDIRVRM